MLARLRQVKQTAAGWTACCPAHDDRHPSLSVSIGQSGGIVVHCHAQQCSAEAIAHAVGLELRDFAPPEMLRDEPPPELSFEQRIVTTYDYRDERGELLYQAVRLRDPKEFRQRRICGAQLVNNKPEPVWEWKLGKTRRVPYRLPELLAAEPSRWVAIVEGEKDADNLTAVGILATTAAQGAGKWGTLDPRSLEAFRARKVAILPDRDAPGIRHAIQVAESLASIAAEVRIVELIGLGDGGDVSDWLAADGTAEKLMVLIQLAPNWNDRLRDALAARADEYDAQKKASKAAAKGEKDDKPAAEIRLTDVGNSLRFASQHRDDARYCGMWGQWLIWAMTHWMRDETHRIDLLAKETVRMIFREAGAQSHNVGTQLDTWRPGEAESENDKLKKSMDSVKALGMHALKSESAPRIAAMLRLAQSELAVAPSQLDADPFLLNCLNGTIDLRTGAFREHRREDYLTVVAPVEYDPSATCPDWEASLQSIFPEEPLTDDAPGDVEMIAFVRRLFGLCLSGDVSEQVLVICHGDGSNGKTLVLETLCSILGPYASPAPEGLLMVRRGDAHPTELADLFGRRLVHAAETGEGAKLDESRVKRLTGSEKIKARFCNQDFFSFVPTHKLVVCTNHRPRVRGTDHAIWRRVLMIPFGATFWDDADRPRNSRDVRLPRFRKNKALTRTKFQHERSGILNWLLAGFRDWQNVGLCPPEKIKVAAEEYRQSEDLIGQFVAEWCELESSNDYKTKSGDLYSAFIHWCEENAERALSVTQKAFTIRIEQMTGFKVQRTTARFLPGITIRPEAQTRIDEKRKNKKHEEPQIDL